MDNFNLEQFDDPEECGKLLAALMTRAITDDFIFNVSVKAILAIHGKTALAGIMSLAFDRMKNNAITAFDKMNADEKKN